MSKLAPNEAWCMYDKKPVVIQNPMLKMTKNNKTKLEGLCPFCGKKVGRFVSSNIHIGSGKKKHKKGDGLLGQTLGLPGGKVPILGDLPIIGSLF